MARLTWRIQNLPTYTRARLARKRCKALFQVVRSYGTGSNRVRDEEVIEADALAAVTAKNEQLARKELGVDYELVAMGSSATIDGLFDELRAEQKLQDMIGECVKQLLHLRGAKSLARANSAPPARQLAPPAKAA
jgi:hypothetical protein